MKKWIFLLLTLCLTLTLFSAMAEDNTVSFVFTKGGFEGIPENDVIKQKIEEACDVTLNHIAPPAANYDEKVNIILSSNDLPDLIKLSQTHFNDMFDYADQGALMDLTDLVAEHCPNILANIPQEALERCKVDGRLYGIPIWSSPQRMNFIVRQDWLDKLGLAAPTTLDELHDVMKAFVDKDPDGNGANDTYGYTGRGLEGLEPIFGAFGFTGVAFSYWFEDENGQLKPSALHPNAPEALALIKAWYDEGLIDPEFVILKNESEINDKAMKNQWGFYYQWWTYEPKIEMEMQKVDPNVKFARIAPPIGPDGLTGVRGVNLTNGVVVMLQSAKNVEACLRLLDWYHTEEGMMTAYTGVEGIHWEKRSDGTYVTLPQYEADQKWIQWYSAFESEWPLLMVETPLVQSRRDALNWPVITNAADGMLTDAELRYKTDLQDFVTTSYFNFITGKADLADWEQFAEDFYAKGGAEWEQELNALKAQKGAQ